MKITFFAVVKRISLVAALLVLSGCAAYTLKPAGVTKVGNMQFQSTMTWNKIPSGYGPNTEVWTADGALLNQFVFVSGIQSGKAMFRDFSKDTPMPKFSAKVLPHELKALVETSLTNTSGGKYPFTGSNLKPRKVADVTGIEFDLEFFNADGLLNRGKVLAFVKNDKLYSVIFFAANTYHYDHYNPEFEAIVKSITL
ncbi:MAG: hypothetical protein B0W54_17615 [Cellvibrio sp. 79]|nr:MAG: hypothetical protein B0W54_17615 [Cellvibrio sp. 79]